MIKLFKRYKLILIKVYSGENKTGNACFAFLKRRYIYLYNSQKYELKEVFSFIREYLKF